MWPRMVPNDAQGIGGVIERFAPNSRLDPVRRLAPFSATSSPMDDPGRFGYLHTSLSTLSRPNVLSGVEIAGSTVCVCVGVWGGGRGASARATPQGGFKWVNRVNPIVTHHICTTLTRLNTDGNHS